jgi:hypothetical protein
MGIENGKCDSCEKEVDILFPIAILTDLPSGGEGLVQRWYCITCHDAIEAEAETLDNSDDKDDEENDDEEEEPDRPIDCGCCGRRIILGEGTHPSDYLCGCLEYICVQCENAFNKLGDHDISDHKKACREKGLHS